MSHGELLEMCCLIQRSFLATLGCVDVCLGWWLKLRLHAARNATTPSENYNNCQQSSIEFDFF